MLLGCTLPHSPYHYRLYCPEWCRSQLDSSLPGGAGLLLMYFLNHFNMKGGGALAALILGMAVSQMWARGWPRPLAKRPDAHYAHRHALHQCLAVFGRLHRPPLPCRQQDGQASAETWGRLAGL